MAKLPQSRRTEIVIQEIDDEIMIYDLRIDKMLCLNKTAATVWNACDGKTHFDELKRRHKYSDEIIYLALDELKSCNLIAEDYISPFAGVSRREIVRKVGLVSLIALPVISSLLVPIASQAASSRSVLVTCSAPSQCQSGNCVASAAGGLYCCNAGVGGGGFTGVGPGSGTCTPAGTCGTTYSTTRCCTQNGSRPGSFFCPAPFESCVCN